VSAVDTVSLDTAFVDHGVPHVAFWNGRVLTAEDLRAEQAANQQARRRLGRAVGAGVVSGLAVRPAVDAAQVEVTSGVAVDRLGQTIELPVDICLSLVVPPDTAHGDGVFTVCEPIASSPTGTGVYLLVVRSASGSRSSVAGVPAFGSGVATECGPRYTVDGVSFRLVGVDAHSLAQASGHDPADLAVLDAIGTGAEAPTARNVLAHLFLASRAWPARLGDPFGVDPEAIEPGALAALLEDQVSSCEVPIALITWSFGGVDQVDTWAVRRPPTAALELTAVQALVGRSRELTGRATYCQFQDQLAAVLDGLGASGRTGFRLVDRFRHLPAAGLVPVARAGRAGFSADVLDGLVTRAPLPLEPARVGALLDESVHHGSVDAESGEVLTVYTVLTPGGDLDHLIFCTGRMAVIEAELVIDAVFPAGLLAIGQQIEIRGRNFGFSTGDGRVSFDGTNADPQEGSTDTRLLVEIPQTLDVEPGGSEVTLEVRSDHGADSVPLIIGHPVQPALGHLLLTWNLVEPPVLVAGGRAEINYTLRSFVDQAVTVTLSLDGTPSVVSSAEIQDKDGVVTTQVELEPDASVQLDVVVPAVPGPFTLILRAVAGDIIEDDTREFPVGEPIPDADHDITFVPVDFDVQGSGSGSLVGSTISLGAGSIGTLELAAEIIREGTFEVLVESVASFDSWVVMLSEPDDSPGIGPADLVEVTAADLADDGKAERTIRIDMQPSDDGSAPDTDLRVVVRESGSNKKATTTYTLISQ
jgi:hypothetical protein